MCRDGVRGGGKNFNEATQATQTYFFRPSECECECKMGPMYPATLAAGRGQQTGSFSYNRQQQRGRERGGERQRELAVKEF